jgi:hypothetical protein
MNEQTRYIVAGLLSTTEFTPAQEHPSRMLPLADRVLEVVAWLHEQSSPSGR